MDNVPTICIWCRPKYEYENIAAPFVFVGVELCKVHMLAPQLEEALRELRDKVAHNYGTSKEKSAARRKADALLEKCAQARQV